MIPGSCIHAVIPSVDWILLPQKCAYWPDQKTLIVSDAHIGKVSHFRKHGIALPLKAEDDNFIKLSFIIEALKPEHIIWLGDLFHSRANEANQTFLAWRQKYREIQMTLVLGNHDILAIEDYIKLDMEVVKELKLEGIIFTHEPMEDNKSDMYNIAGHIHPVAALKGKGGQNINIPCFYFGKDSGIMPAFGSFTGGFKIKFKKGDNVFSITPNEVAQVKFY